MTEKESKKGVGVLLAVLGSIAGIALLTRKGKAEEPPPEDGAASIVITIEGEGGGIAGVISADPNALVEGSTYNAIVTVYNKSTKLGVNWPATLTVKVTSVLAGVLLAADKVETYEFGALGSRTFTYSFTIPVGAINKTGLISVNVFAPGNYLIKFGSLAIATMVAPIDYFADVTIGIP